MKAKELLEKKLKKYSAKQLVGKLEKGNVSTVETEVIIKILEKRGQNVSKWKAEAPIEDNKVEEIIERGTEAVFDEKKKEELKEQVDSFVDELIEQKRNGVYNEVMKSLGGKFNSDLDDLLEEASIEQLKDAISFKGIDSAKKKEEEKEKVESKVESKKVKKVKKESKSGEKNYVPNVYLEKSKELEGLEVGSKIKFSHKQKGGELKKLEGEVFRIYISKRLEAEAVKVKCDGKKYNKPVSKIELL